MKVAMMGHSGSGKTTQCLLLNNRMGLAFTANSAGLIIPAVVQQKLHNKYGWSQSGHADVIRLSNINPGFGLDFQDAVLEARTNFIMDNDDFIIDRSPVDNVTYFLLQASHLQSERSCQKFIETAQYAYRKLTHVVLLSNPSGEIEDNGSRVANSVYQGMVASVFNYVFEKYFKGLEKGPKVLILDTWGEIEDRYTQISSFLES